ncbi:MAG TPA: hypothetical protein VF255_05400, partial [Solirubrobacterales bacterium]
MNPRTTLIRIAIALVALAAMLGGATSAAAYETGQSLDPEQFAIQSFAIESSDPRAGATTNFRNVIAMKKDKAPTPPNQTVPYGRLKRVEVDLPPGLVGDPTAFPTCSVELFLRAFNGCPVQTQIGTAGFEAFSVGGEVRGPVYNLEPGQDEPALFGFKPSFALYGYLTIEVSADGEMTAVAEDNPMYGAIMLADVTMWGVPADANPATPAGSPRVPFLRNSTNCVEPFAVRAIGFAYEGQVDEAEGTLAPRTECESVPFEPTMSFAPTSKEAGAPTGLEVNVTVPQHEDPDKPATAHVKDVTMTLPEGMTVSAASAGGLGSCAPDQFGYHEETPISCPESSKIGEVEVQTPILDVPLKGPVYVAKQSDNPFKSLLALYMAPSAKGVTIKLAGKVGLDPGTGRITTTFLNNPQQPFSNLRVSLKGGPRAPLTLPASCGTYAATAELTSWAMPDLEVPLSSSFGVDEGCGKGSQFTPGFAAGTTERMAGSFSPFTLRLTRPDGQPNLSHFEATLPEGLLAKLAGVPLCSDAAAASAQCPAASRVGDTTVGVGAGTMPVFAPEPGKPPTALYLAGPYKGAPYSIVAEVPAQAGPFDLGTVVVRNALRIDPRTTRVTAVSDPLPQILQGIPISYRDVRVDVDRPGFTINPTSCETMTVDGTVASAAGQVVPVADRFGVGGCKALGFKPKLALRLDGGTKRNRFPALTATLRARPGDANLDRVSVALPRSEFLEQGHIRTVCTRVQFAADQCPSGSVYGHARAVTPLLDQPLEGPVYLRSSDNQLPDLVAALSGPVEIELAGRIDSVRGGIRTTFDFVPDAPVSSFVLRMQGGQKGLLVNSRDVCRAVYRATVKMDGQNGRERDFRPVLEHTSCGKQKDAA